ncbi:MAG: hypothetical protein A2083_10810 [Gemmatimonadetes bacterium GWC2_71_9]|nr:MAG: hypothetical protein A2083_10810 [Gemmatimonadetes bacterium GWC2_71_9]
MAMQSIVPSASASRSAATSCPSRNGGFILAWVLYPSHAASVRARWCGVTSAVTRTPRAFASRTMRAAPAVEVCARCTCPPVSSARAMSRATITSSAARGIPLIPSRVAVSPSCIAPPEDRLHSSQWSMTGMPKLRAYSRAVRIRCAVATGRPSSETATAPAAISSPNSVSCSPF